jgi:hypothetical protein
VRAEVVEGVELAADTRDRDATLQVGEVVRVDVVVLRVRLRRGRQSATTVR